jgi:hypothetical protein
VGERGRAVAAGAQQAGSRRHSRTEAAAFSHEGPVGIFQGVEVSFSQRIERPVVCEAVCFAQCFCFRFWLLFVELRWSGC